MNAAKIAEKEYESNFLTGKKGGDIIKYSDTCIHIKNQKTSFIQETQLIILHIICEMLGKNSVKKYNVIGEIGINHNGSVELAKKLMFKANR